MKKITKAVIPAAGLGTRMLPIAKSIPKEMLPIVDKPCMQYLVEEAVASGITDILIITGRGKESIEDYFDYSLEYNTKLAVSGKEDMIAQLNAIANMANISFVRQKEAKGLGHAVYCAKSFIGNEPFAVLYGDDVIVSETPVVRQLMNVYEEFGLGVAGVKSVLPSLIGKYCSLKVSNIRDNIYSVSDMVEKPTPERIFSLLSILGRVILPPEVFAVLETTPRGANNEIQLTDAMRALAIEKGMTACEFEGRRYDIGSKIGMLIANIEQGLKHPETGEELREFLKGLEI